MMKKFVVSLLLAAVFASAAVATVNACLTPGYWKNHPDAWPTNTITLGGVTYNKEPTIVILKTPPRGDATYILAHALIAAKLNVLSGAGGYDTLITNADVFLIAHPLGTNPKGTDRSYCVSLAEQLDTLNNR